MSCIEARRQGTWRWLFVATLGLSLLSLVLTACGAASTPGSSATATPTTSPVPPVQVFFARHPETDSNPGAVFPVTRATTMTTTQSRATYALQEMLKGPTTTERARNYYSPFDGQLALQSVCPGEVRDFDLALDHRGSAAETGTATVQFCRRVDIPGDLAGPRMTAMIQATLLQFPQIKQVVTLNYQGDCFDDLQGKNACLNGQQSGYPVQVFFSKHPDSDTAPTKVFPVNRTSPTLGVATYAIAQLLAGPIATEKGRGYFTPLEGALSGASSCGGAEFKVTLDWNRTHAEAGVATLQFCRDVAGLGDTGAVLARNEINSTLKQFSNIHEVVITYKDGACFDDLIGCD